MSKNSSRRSSAVEHGGFEKLVLSREASGGIGRFIPQKTPLSTPLSTPISTPMAGPRFLPKGLSLDGDELALSILGTPSMGSRSLLPKVGGMLELGALPTPKLSGLPTPKLSGLSTPKLSGLSTPISKSEVSATPKHASPAPKVDSLAALSLLDSLSLAPQEPEEVILPTNGLVLVRASGAQQVDGDNQAVVENNASPEPSLPEQASASILSILQSPAEAAPVSEVEVVPAAAPIQGAEEEALTIHFDLSVAELAQKDGLEEPALIPAGSLLSAFWDNFMSSATSSAVTNEEAAASSIKPEEATTPNDPLPLIPNGADYEPASYAGWSSSDEDSDDEEYGQGEVKFASSPYAYPPIAEEEVNAMGEVISDMKI
jgi:hypothetical protein